MGDVSCDRLQPGRWRRQFDWPRRQEEQPGCSGRKRIGLGRARWVSWGQWSWKVNQFQRIKSNSDMPKGFCTLHVSREFPRQGTIPTRFPSLGNVAIVGHRLQAAAESTAIVLTLGISHSRISFQEFFSVWVHVFGCCFFCFSADRASRSRSSGRQWSKEKGLNLRQDRLKRSANLSTHNVAPFPGFLSLPIPIGD